MLMCGAAVTTFVTDSQSGHKDVPNGTQHNRVDFCYFLQGNAGPVIPFTLSFFSCEQLTIAKGVFSCQLAFTWPSLPITPNAEYPRHTVHVLLLAALAAILAPDSWTLSGHPP